MRKKPMGQDCAGPSLQSCWAGHALTPGTARLLLFEGAYPGKVQKRPARIRIQAMLKLQLHANWFDGGKVPSEMTVPSRLVRAMRRPIA